MELDEFVKKSLLQLLAGIDGAQKEGKYGCVVPKRPDAFNQNVKFDVAVTVEEGVGTDVGAKINVFGSKVGAEVDGRKNTETVTRISFSVPVQYSIGGYKNEQN